MSSLYLFKFEMERINLEHSMKKLPVGTVKRKEEKIQLVIKRIRWKTIKLTSESNKEKTQKGMN